MRNLLLALLLALLGANNTHALNLCARIDQASGEPKEGASIRFRSKCRAGEASFGTTAELAMIRENRADIESITEVLDTDRSDVAPPPVATTQSVATAPTAEGCGLTVRADSAEFNLCNVRVRSGLGSTDGWDGAESNVNGLGNLIVGYDEVLPNSEKTGSHNLIVGPSHSYTNYAGIVGGRENTATGSFASVLGGSMNVASGYGSIISGGTANTASGTDSSVLGGQDNTAQGTTSSVSGGESNLASGTDSSVLGGRVNTASGLNASISGGNSNLAITNEASVSGGQGNTASGLRASVSGGLDVEASGNYSSVSGGRYNTASGDSASVLGGEFQTASTYTGVAP